ncbi:hypothetical protein HK105_208586 [Polyrhizophydium stewartii]|uniref:Uncharacterized protein n=1 Tax=Polyrhizophydium stewartii TaxID=2732419 RepID=A0ABR4MX87_9FUNG
MAVSAELSVLIAAVALMALGAAAYACATLLGRPCVRSRVVPLASAAAQMRKPVWSSGPHPQHPQQQHPATGGGTRPRGARLEFVDGAWRRTSLKPRTDPRDPYGLHSHSHSHTDAQSHAQAQAQADSRRADADLDLDLDPAGERRSGRPAPADVDIPRIVIEDADGADLAGLESPAPPPMPPPSQQQHHPPRDAGVVFIDVGSSSTSKPAASTQPAQQSRPHSSRSRASSESLSPASAETIHRLLVPPRQAPVAAVPVRSRQANDDMVVEDLD